MSDLVETSSKQELLAGNLKRIEKEFQITDTEMSKLEKEHLRLLKEKAALEKRLKKARAKLELSESRAKVIEAELGMTKDELVEKETTFKNTLNSLLELGAIDVNVLTVLFDEILRLRNLAAEAERELSAAMEGRIQTLGREEEKLIEQDLALLAEEMSILDSIF